MNLLQLSLAPQLFDHFTEETEHAATGNAILSGLEPRGLYDGFSRSREFQNGSDWFLHRSEIATD
jgi:hypothetical protein